MTFMDIFTIGLCGRSIIRRFVLKFLLIDYIVDVVVKRDFSLDSKPGRVSQKLEGAYLSRHYWESYGRLAGIVVNTMDELTSLDYASD